MRWIKSYLKLTFGGITPEVAAEATHKSARTFIQTALPILVAAGVGAFSGGVLLAAALTGGAAVVAFWMNALGK